MPDGVLNYSSIENLSTGFRIETDGPVTRLYRAPPPKWIGLSAAVACFSAFTVHGEILITAVSMLLRFGHHVRNVDLYRLVWPYFVLYAMHCVIWLALGVFHLRWYRRWGRTPTVIEASPEGLTYLWPGFRRIRTRFFPTSRIKRFELKHARGLIRMVPDRLTLYVRLYGRLPRRWSLPTRSLADAQRARDALAKSLGLP